MRIKVIDDSPAVTPDDSPKHYIFTSAIPSNILLFMPIHPYQLALGFAGSSQT